MGFHRVAMGHPHQSKRAVAIGTSAVLILAPATCWASGAAGVNSLSEFARQGEPSPSGRPRPSSVHVRSSKPGGARSTAKGSTWLCPRWGRSEPHSLRSNRADQNFYAVRAAFVDHVGA
jgi:hypothetical protein